MDMITYEKDYQSVAPTTGDGLYTSKAKPVCTVAMKLRVLNPNDKPIGELMVAFDPNSWNEDVDGLIYTDSGFLANLKANLKSYFGFTDDQLADVDYSELGMQGKRYVSLDVPKSFIDAFSKL